MSITLDKITTKQGDKGCALAFLSAKQRKNHAEIAIFGELDELNAVLGMALHAINDVVQSQHQSLIIHIQNRLFDIGAQLYTNQARLNKEDIYKLEQMITEITSKLPALNSFIIPSDKTATWHLARAVCRRVERAVWGIYFDETIADHANDNKADIQLIGQYFNRLSDLLFCIARFYDETTALWQQKR